jgi:hypothetical protein
VENAVWVHLFDLWLRAKGKVLFPLILPEFVPSLCNPAGTGTGLAGTIGRKASLLFLLFLLVE